MKVYVIVLAQVGDFYWYILDEANWNKLDDREFCEQIHEVEHLAALYNIQDLFDMLKERGWTVEAALEGVTY